MIGNKTKNELVDMLCADDESQSNRAVTNIIIDSAISILNRHKDNPTLQYSTSDKMLEVLNYNEEQYRQNKRYLTPEKHFSTLSCFADALNEKEVIKRDLGDNLPELQSESEEEAFFQKVSQTTKSCVTTIVDLYQKEYSAKLEDKKSVSNLFNLAHEQEKGESKIASSSTVSADSKSGRSVTWQDIVLAREITSETQNRKRCANGLAKNDNNENDEWTEPLQNNEGDSKRWAQSLEELRKSHKNQKKEPQR